MRRRSIILGLAALTVLGTDQALVGFAGEIRTGSRWQTRLRLFASQPAVGRDDDRGGALLARIPSFGLIGGQGDVYLPVRTVRIAIPEGTGPVRLQAVKSRPESLPGLSLGAPLTGEEHYGTATKGRRAAGPEGARRAPGERGFIPPGRPVRMGDVGYLRDQRFVEVVYTPVVSPPGGGEALFHGEVDLDIVVEGVTKGAVADRPARRDPLFEDLYRRTFANYEQGRMLRTRRHEAPPAARTRTGAGSEGAAAVSGAAVQSGFPAYKIFVSRDGIYRLSGSFLLDPNGGAAPGLAGADPRQFKIMSRGIEVPIRVEGESDGVFDPGDFIEFYGQRLDGPETLLNYDLGLLPNIYQYDDYGDLNVYWLSVDAAGTRQRIPSRSAPPSGSDPLEPDFQDTLVFEVDNLYQPTGPADPFLMTPRLNSNGGSVAADPNNCSFTNTGIPNQPGGVYLGPDITDPNDPNYCAICRVTVPSANPAAASPATVTLSMRGTTDDTGANPDHLAVMEINGDPSLYSVNCWDRNVFTSQSVQVPHSQLTATLDIRVEQPGLAATAGNEQLLVDRAEVTYRRLFEVVDDGLRFTIPDASRRIAVAGLSTSDANQVTVLEITETQAPAANLGGPDVIMPVLVTGGTFSGGAGNFTLTFNNDDDPNSVADRAYHVAGPGSGGFLLPDAVVEDVPSTLADPTNEADVIVIGDATLMDLSPSSPFMQYWSHRTSVDGYVVEFASDDDIYDEFGFGIEHPEAFRRFLNYAYDNWKGPGLDPNRPPPAFVTLVGDTTADPKNNLGRSDWVNLLPAFMMYQESAILGFYASDNVIAAFRGADQLADAHLGRISVATAAEADTVFSKLLAYETPPGGSWIGKGLFITDRGTAPGESSEFERITDVVVDGYWQPQPPMSATKLYYDDPAFGGGTMPAAFKDAMRSEMDGGVTMMHYTGHGAFSIYGGTHILWRSSDVDSLAPTSGKYFFSINENCLSGGFHFIADDALSEAFLKAPDKGAVAFFAPAGLSFAFVGEVINDQIYGDMFGPSKVRRFGQLISNVRSLLSGLGSIIDVQSYTLIGDPTQRFALPAPAPPVGFAAAGGDEEVTLSWSPSPDPNTGTRIYRSTVPSGPYTLITPSAGVGGTSFVDTGLVNATTYFYYAVSVMPAGFEGAQTNLNDDCSQFDPPSSGPQCVWARPLNPIPPATPIGAVVFGDGTGERLKVTWTPNLEPDIADYIARYGTQSGGPYPGETAAGGGGATELVINGLTEGTTYYVVLVAKNTSDLESSPTSQMEGVPLKFPGESPPAFIEDLTVVVTPGDPNSLTLQWSHSGLDIYGAPTTLAAFQIYRGETPGFVPSPANLVADITDPAVTSWTDTGAAASPQDYYYVVGAKDARGLAGGLGFELPDGVDDLSPSIINGGATVRFEWTPVTTDVKGGQTMISKYVLYADGTPVSRSDIDAMSPLVDDITGSFVEVPVDPAQQFYTLIVVDTRGNKSPF